MIFVIGFSFIYLVSQDNLFYQQAAKNNNSALSEEGSEHLTVYGFSSSGNLGFNVNNTGITASIISFWIFNGTSGSLLEYMNATYTCVSGSCTKTSGVLPYAIAQGSSWTYSNTGFVIASSSERFILKILTQRGTAAIGTYPSDLLTSSAVNSLVAGGFGSLQMSFSSFNWYDYDSGPAAQSSESISYSDGCSYNQCTTYFDNVCANGKLCGLGIDGSSYNGCTHAQTCQVTLTTANPNDVIILTGYETSSSIHISSISDGDGLTWHTRKQLSNSGQGGETEEWYAIASTALSSDTITVTYSSSSTTGGITAFGISGANTNSPFDPNLASPVTNTGSSSTPSVSLTTTNANDLIIGIVSCYKSSGFSTITVGSAFTQAAGPANPQCSSEYGVPEYETVSSTQSGLAVGFSLSSTASWSMIGDAVEAAVSSSSWVVDLANPHQGSLTPEGFTAGCYVTSGEDQICTYDEVPMVFSVNITNDDPSLGTIVLNSETNIWITETCDFGSTEGNCPAGNPVFIFYGINVNPTTGAISSTTQGSYSQIVIPYGATKTLYYGAEFDLSLNNFNYVALSSYNANGQQLSYYGEFAVFLLFSGTKITQQSIEAYGQNIPFESTSAADNLGSYSETPMTCTAGQQSDFELTVDDSPFSNTNYGVNKIVLNASAFNSITAPSPPSGWSSSISNGFITWTAGTQITPGGSLTFPWDGTPPSSASGQRLILPLAMYWSGGTVVQQSQAEVCND